MLHTKSSLPHSPTKGKPETTQKPNRFAPFTRRRFLATLGRLAALLPWSFSVATVATAPAAAPAAGPTPAELADVVTGALRAYIDGLAAPGPGPIAAAGDTAPPDAGPSPLDAERTRLIDDWADRAGSLARDLLAWRGMLIQARAMNPLAVDALGWEQLTRQIMVTADDLVRNMEISKFSDFTGLVIGRNHDHYATLYDLLTFPVDTPRFDLYQREIDSIRHENPPLAARMQAIFDEKLAKGGAA